LKQPNIDWKESNLWRKKNFSQNFSLFFQSFFMPSLSLEFPSGQEIHSTRHAELTPLALLSILNHYSRCEQDEHTVGVLLGTRSGDKVTATQTIPLQLTQDNKINLELLEQMYSLLKELNPQEALIGWYQFSQLSQLSTEINNQLMEEISPKQPLILSIEHEKFGLEYPIQCYVPKPCKTPQSTSKGAIFLKIPFKAGSLANDLEQLSFGSEVPTNKQCILKLTSIYFRRF
jgi:hypothetical protein